MTKKLLTFSLYVLLMGSLNLIACAEDQKSSDKTPAAAKTAAPQMSNEQIADFIRKNFNVPGNVAITVSQRESEVAGLSGLKIEFKGDRGTQTENAWLTGDQVLIVGKTFDLKVDPFKRNWDKVSFKNVPVKGNADAKVTVVEYSDYQCPFCSRAHDTMNEVLKQYEGKVKVVFKHLPLNIHNWAEDAAVAAACVQQQNNDAFWKVSDYLFPNQKEITKETVKAKIIDVAKQSNVDTAKLQQCIDTKATLPQVQADMKEAQELGFTSTPSFLINGRSLIGAVPAEQMKEAIDEALKNASK